MWACVCFRALRGPGSSLVLTDSVESLQLFRPGHKGEHLIGSECRDRGFQFGQSCRDTHSACCVCVFCFVTFVLPSHITHYNPPPSLERPHLTHTTSYSTVMHNNTATTSAGAVVNNCAICVRDCKTKAVKVKPDSWKSKNCFWLSIHTQFLCFDCSFRLGMQPANSFTRFCCLFINIHNGIIPQPGG